MDARHSWKGRERKPLSHPTHTLGHEVWAGDTQCSSLFLQEKRKRRVCKVPNSVAPGQTGEPLLSPVLLSGLAGLLCAAQEGRAEAALLTFPSTP